MSDLTRVRAWFDSGALLRPDYHLPSLVSLGRALAALCGAELELDPPAKRVAEAIGVSQHYVFLLADGLGMNVLQRRPHGFLARHCVMELRSVFPSSTAPALTSLATGDWPASHAVLSWYLYLPHRDLHAITLPFVERFGRRPLTTLGLSGREVFAAPVLPERQSCDYLALLPAPIANSVYSRYTRGGRPARAYQDLRQAFEYVVRRVERVKGPAFTYVYFSGIDGAEHNHGPSSPEVASAVASLDDDLAALCEALAGRARLVVSADHGSYEVEAQRKHLLAPDDPLLEPLLTLPSGEPPVPLFHARPGREGEFAAAFRSRFGEAFALLSSDEVEELRLLGPSRLSQTTRSRLGQFLAFSSDGSVLLYAGDGGLTQMKGFHGGLMADEVRIPLIVA